MAAVRAPIPEGAGWAWFANRGIGRPLPASIRSSIEILTSWLDTLPVDPAVPVLLFGFSGGTAMAGGLLLDRPEAFGGAALLSGTLPFDPSGSIPAWATESARRR